jgi:hypothetical protein
VDRSQEWEEKRDGEEKGLVGKEEEKQSKKKTEGWVDKQTWKGGEQGGVRVNPVRNGSTGRGERGLGKGSSKQRDRFVLF